MRERGIAGLTRERGRNTQTVKASPAKMMDIPQSVEDRSVHVAS